MRELRTIKHVPSLKWLQEHIGQSVGFWTLLAFAGKHNDHYLAKCRCVCGKEKNVMINNLMRGMTNSCSCMRSASHSPVRAQIRKVTKDEILTILNTAFIMKRFIEVA